MLKWGWCRTAVAAVVLACLAVSPGTAQPAHRVKDIRTELEDPDFGPSPAKLGGLRAVGSHLFFDGGSEGSDLWVSDGTPAGTDALRSVCFGSCLGPQYLAG